jgi:hypothetical protein
MRNVYLIREDDETLLGAIPYRLIVAESIPGEDSVLISQQKAVDA